MYKILSSIPLPKECTDPFKDKLEFTLPEERLSYSELLEKIEPGYSGINILGIKVDKGFLDAASKAGVLVIANDMVGTDNVDIPYATQKGIAIINSPSMVTEPTAEHVCALIMATMRNIACYDREIRNSIWNAPVFSTRAESIYGSTLGIIGLGRIGKRVAAKMQGMGMNIVYYDKFRLPEDKEKELNVTYKEFDELLKVSDCISLNIPYLPENHHLFNGETFKKMKKTAYLVNGARGSIVDEYALYEALRNGVIKGAGLDVFEHEPRPLPELLTLENVTMTPHCATGTFKDRVAIASEAIQGMADYLDGKEPHNLVNKIVMSKVE